LEVQVILAQATNSLLSTDVCISVVTYTTQMVVQ